PDQTSTVAGVVLAGGTSSRFGDANKLLADFDGDPLVRHAVRTLLDAGLREVVVVLGYEADAVRRAVADLGVRTVRNPDYGDGLSTSVARGVRAVADADADAVVFLPGDMPAVAPSTVDLLVDAYRAGLGTALAATYRGRRGNPVLFDRRHFDALLGVEGDVGGRPVLLGADRAGLVATDDPGVTADVDTTDDIERRR
ncbi:MAG: NTP transferase domain-containing protein, partial [Haloferacaceae archaeon]